MQLRKYQPSDCAQLAELFYQTVHSVNAKDYKKEQLDAWATGEVDLQAWDASFRTHRTIIATENGEIVGFGDMNENGYLDRLYVHKDYQGQGVASAICDELERFDAELKDLLLRYQWWNLEPEKLVEILPLLCDPDLKKLRYFLREQLNKDTE